MLRSWWKTQVSPSANCSTNCCHPFIMPVPFLAFLSICLAIYSRFSSRETMSTEADRCKPSGRERQGKCQFRHSMKTDRSQHPSPCLNATSGIGDVHDDDVHTAELTLHVLIHASRHGSAGGHDVDNRVLCNPHRHSPFIIRIRRELGDPGQGTPRVYEGRRLCLACHRHPLPVHIRRHELHPCGLGNSCPSGASRPPHLTERRVCTKVSALNIGRKKQTRL